MHRLAPLACLPFAACMAFFDDPSPAPHAPPPEPGPDFEPVELRACNASGFDFDSIAYSEFTPGGPLADGACTTYQLADRAIFSYDYIELSIGDDVFIYQPIDFVGETPLPGGRWSYRLTILDYASRDLAIEPVQD